jgi:hypothetical protein
MEKRVSDQINHPRHYVLHESGVECIEVVEHLSFCLGNAVKYLWRMGRKGPDLVDLKKAAWYLQRHCDRVAKDYYVAPIPKMVELARAAQKVVACESQGQVLGDVLRLLVVYGEEVSVVLKRVQIEIERVEEHEARDAATIARERGQ